MRKITKSQRINQIADQLARQQGVISKLTIAVKEQNEAILMLEKLTDEKLRDQPEPRLKQLDQSVFDGLDEKWRFAAVDKCGEVWYSTHKTQPSVSGTHLSPEPNADSMQAKGYYDTSNWQNSLIERHTAKELTGSDLARAMLARGDRWILCGNTTDGFASPCIIDGYRCSEDDSGFVLTNGKSIEPRYIHPVNNQGEPLTASEAGL